MMKHMSWAAGTLLLLCGLAYTVPASAQNGGGRAPAQPARTPRTSDGAVLFANTCSVCHGDAGAGGVAPALRGPKYTAS